MIGDIEIGLLSLGIESVGMLVTFCIGRKRMQKWFEYNEEREKRAGNNPSPALPRNNLSQLIRNKEYKRLNSQSQKLYRKKDLIACLVSDPLKLIIGVY